MDQQDVQHDGAVVGAVTPFGEGEILLGGLDLSTFKLGGETVDDYGTDDLIKITGFKIPPRFQR